MKKYFKKDWRPMLRWHVICSKHRNEDLLCQQLQARDIESYLPRVRQHSTKPHLRKIKPYFPGYLFVHMDLDAVGLSTVRWIPGAVGLVCFGGEAAWVTDGILQAIRERVEQINSLGIKARQYLKAGDDMAVHSGPFTGYRGIFSSYLSDCERVIVFLRFIRDQQVRVKLPVRHIRPTNHLQGW